MFGTTTEPVLPFWFKLRQGKAEPVKGSSLIKLSAPNQQDAYVLIEQKENGKWSAALREEPEGANTVETPAEFDYPGLAWNAAFEIYRQTVLV
jgi:hypothetical protein